MDTISCKGKFPLLNDLITAAKVIKTVKEARKRGAYGIKIQPAKIVPLINGGYWDWTPEALLQYPKTPSGTREAVIAVFHTFDEETQHRLTFGPGKYPGALVKRVEFWKEALKPNLPKEQYSAAILTILDWCIWCAKRSNCPGSLEIEREM